MILEKYNIKNIPILDKYKRIVNNDNLDLQTIIGEAFKNSDGGNVHIKGVQDKGKTLLGVAIYRDLITKKDYLPDEAIGNLDLTKLGNGFQIKKGDDLRQFLWDCTHIPFRHRIGFIDEIDSEFPARFFQDREQTEIALRMWHNFKLRNWFIMTSHLGRGTDIIFDLSTNYGLYPQRIDWVNNSLTFICINALDMTITEWTAYNIIELLDKYDRWEMTESTKEDSVKPRPKSKKKRNSEKVERDGETKLKRNINDIMKNNGF